jgi:hypothetical protein
MLYIINYSNLTLTMIRANNAANYYYDDRDERHLYTMKKNFEYVPPMSI